MWRPRLALIADPVRLAQILNNLIANAFKYGDNHSPIRLSATRLEDGFARIEIVNAGPGIPAAEHATLFLSAAAPASGAMCRARGWGFPSPSCWSKHRADALISRAFPGGKPGSG